MARGFSIRFFECDPGGEAIQIRPDAKALNLAKAALRKVLKRSAKLYYPGFSIPILADLAKLLKLDPILCGFGLPQDRIHAPNESLSMAQISLVWRYVTALAAEVAKEGEAGDGAAD